MRAAIAAGYAKGFHTILDANVVTAITALDPVRDRDRGREGLRADAADRHVVSLLTAVAATRAMLGLLAGFRWFDNPRFMGAHGQQTAEVAADRLHAPPLRVVRHLRRRSSSAGVVSLGVRGLNLGIDFKGGMQITFNDARPPDVGCDGARRSPAHAGQADAVVQGRGSAVNGEATRASRSG